MLRNDPRKALGKGLHSLLPARNTSGAAAAPAPLQEPVAPEGAVTRLPVSQIAPNPDQPRRDFDETALMELAQSIEQDGILQPIIVRKIEANSYQIIAGERRWRAASLAGLKEVPVILMTANDQHALELALVENIQRENLNAIELATTFHRMATELGMSHEEIGQKTSKERTTVTNAVRLLQLPADIQASIAAGRLTPGHARALLKFENHEEQRRIAARCIAEGWSVRQIEQFTKPVSRSGPDKTKPNDETVVDPNVKFALSELQRALGTKVRIIEGAKGKGKIEIEYYSTDDLSRIYEMIVPTT